jgi:hypothetical protein
LLLLNDAFVVSASTHLAERLRREHPGDARAQIARAWRLLFSAPASDADTHSALAFLAEQTETLRAGSVPPPKKDAPPAPDPQLQAFASLCQALLGTNCFLYVE